MMNDVNVQLAQTEEHLDWQSCGLAHYTEIYIIYIYINDIKKTKKKLCRIKHVLTTEML